MAQLQDIREVKSLLEIEPDDTSEDKRLLFCIEYASRWIEELLNRPGLTYSAKTEYYKGTNTQKLCLRGRPVYPNPTDGNPAITVNTDEQGLFGAAPSAFTNTTTNTTLIYGQDYTLQIDQADGSSRSGILWRINALWNRPLVRQTGFLSPFFGDDPGNIQVIYTGGYTIDKLPGNIRLAALMLISRMRYVLPLGLELGSESYEERSIGIIAEKKGYWTSLVKPLLAFHRNWKF